MTDGENIFQMMWWSLGKPYPEDGLGWGKYRVLYNDNWLGLTICSPSSYEENRIVEFISKLGEDVKTTKWEKYTEINFTSKSACFWFKNKSDHDAFVEMLENIPPRSVHMKWEKYNNFPVSLRDKNYAIHEVFMMNEGDEKMCLTIENCDDPELVILKLSS